MKNYRNLLTFSFLAIAFTFFLASCKKDVVEDLGTGAATENATTNNEDTASGALMNRMDEMDDLCFEFVYPITVELPDGTQETANDDDGLEDIFENYYIANPTSDEDPMLVFPLDIIDGETGEKITLEDEDELYFMLEMCFDDEWEECFTINYPVTVVFPDGSTQTVNDDEELETTFDDWYEANPNSEEDPTLEFPIEVTGEDGEVISIADEDELEELFDDCFDEDWDDEDYELCFDLVFPITVNLPDGTSQEANDYDELDEIFMTYFEENPMSEDFPTIAYPISVELEDGEIVSVNSDEELEELFEECEDFEDDWNDCFSFNYAITLVFPDGSTAEVNSDEELYEAVDTWYEANPTSDEDPTLQFPVDVTTEDGDVLTLNNEEELDELLEDCFECLVVNGDGLVVGNAQATMTALVVKQHAKVKAVKKARVAKTLSK